MGDGEKAPLRLKFNPKARLEFHGSTITSDAGLLPFREFDEALGLTGIAGEYLQDRRTGRNILHHLVPLLRDYIWRIPAGAISRIGGLIWGIPDKWSFSG